MLIPENWTDYEILDTGDGQKLERWGPYSLIRPDPQIIWPKSLSSSAWEKADAVYTRSSSGGGSWSFTNRLPDKWTISYKNLSFHIEPTGFKHTGLFPEQAVNWEWITNKIKSSERKINLLNLFAYTGGITVAAAAAGASVCHVDASKGMVARAKENLALSGLADKPVRLIVDDVLKFVQRETRRGAKYDAIVMDPPSYGRGPKGEIWKIEDMLFELLSECTKVLSDTPLFFIINSYTTGFSPQAVGNVLKLTVGKSFSGKTECDEIGLPVKASNLVLPCGMACKWYAN